MIATPHRITRGFASLVATVVLFVAVPVGLIAASRARFGSANPLHAIDPPWRWDLDRLGDAISQPLRDDAVVNLLIRSSMAIVWLALGVIAITIVTEVVHMIRHQGLAAPQVRGLGWAQRVGRWVAIGLLALLPVNSFSSAATALDHAGPAATAQRLGALPSSVTPLGHDDRGTSIVSGRGGIDASASPVAPAGTAFDTAFTPVRADAPAVHVIQRGESIYGIAADYAAGDESRTNEIADEILDLNLDRVMDDGLRFTNPALIQPGWTLTLPDGIGTAGTVAPHSTPNATPAIDVPDAPGVELTDDDPTPERGIPRVDADDASAHTTYMVVRGDTLSGIAADHLGDEQDWPAIWEANRGDDMGGGRTFDDPDLILPGWELDVPAAERRRSRTPSDESGTVSDSATPPSESTGPDSVPNTVDVVPEAPVEATVEATVEDGSPAVTAPPPEVAPVPDANEPIPTTATTMPNLNGAGDAGGDTDPRSSAPRAPSPIRLEHAALLAAGVLTLVGVRRRRALRSALPHARVPVPPPEVAATERRMRSIDPGERSARIDVAVRAASWHLLDHRGADRVGPRRQGRTAHASAHRRCGARRSVDR